MNPWTLGNTLKWPPSWVVGEKQSSQDDWSRKFDTSPSHILEHGSTSGTHGNYGSLFSSSRCWRRNRKLPGRFWSSFWLWLGPQDFRRWIGERTWTERSRGYLGVIIIWESPGWSMALLTRNGDLKEFFLEEPRIRIRGQLWTSDIFILATWHWSESWTSLCRLTNLYMIWACIERERVSRMYPNHYIQTVAFALFRRLQRSNSLPKSARSETAEWASLPVTAVSHSNDSAWQFLLAKLFRGFQVNDSLMCRQKRG